MRIVHWAKSVHMILNDSEYGHFLRSVSSKVGISSINNKFTFFPLHVETNLDNKVIIAQLS